LNFEYFIANRTGNNKSLKLSKPVVRISKVSIAIGLALMITSVAIVIGFKKSVSSKIEGFTSDIKLVLFDNGKGLQNNPIILNNELISSLNNNNDIKAYQAIATKATVVKTQDQILGAILKGVDHNFDGSFIRANIILGTFPDIDSIDKTNDVVISNIIAGKLSLKVGDDLRMWFIDEDESNARGRKFNISGIYSTGVEEIDNLYVIGDLKHIQRLNNWGKNEVGSVELFVYNKDRIPDISFGLYNTLPYNIRAISVFEEFPQIYNWLGLLDMNVIVILTLLIVVSTITMISTLLILIMERTSMVGVLKALGATNQSIRKIFIYRATRIILSGMFWGNIIGLVYYFLQSRFEIVKLSPESYYVDHVPVELQFSDVLFLNIGTLVISFLVLIIPTWYITRIRPSKALRYE
jgi:lipoprotein-releasing system permease protein